MFKKYLITSLIVLFLPLAVKAAKLTAESVDDREGAVEVDKGEQDFLFSEIEFTADDIEDIKITAIKVTRTGGTDDDINKVRLYDGFTQIGSAQIWNNTIITFDDLDWTIPKGQSKTLSLKADVSVSAGGGHVIYLNILGSEGTGHVVAEGVETEEAAETDCYVLSRPITITDTVIDTQAPGSPMNISVSNASDSSTLKLNISWTDSSASDLASVKVYRSTQYGELGSVVNTASPSEDSTRLNWYVDSGLSADTEYYYILRSVDESGNESENMDQYGATPKLSTATEPVTAILKTSLSTTLASTKISQGLKDFTFLKFKLSINDVTHWTLKKIELTREGGDSNDLENVELYSGDNLVATTTSLASSRIVLDTGEMVLEKGSEYVFTVKADISPTADAGHGIYFKTGLIDAVPSNAYSYSGSSKTGSATGQTMIIIASSASTVSETTDTTTTDASDTQTQTSATRLIRASNQYQVYKVIEGKKLWIPTAEAFNKMGNNWNDIEAVSNTDSYQRLKLARVSGNDEVYYLTEGGLKRYIPSTAVFESYGNKWEDVVDISSTDLEAYPDSFLIRLEGGVKVYKLENGKKRWIKTAEAFERLGYNWGDIAPVNATELAAYEEGAEIEG